MDVTYQGPDGTIVRLPDGGVEYVEAGQKLQANVPASFKRELVAQGWKPSGGTKKPGAKRASAKKSGPAAAAPAASSPAETTTEEGGH